MRSFEVITPEVKRLDSRFLPERLGAALIGRKSEYIPHAPGLVMVTIIRLGFGRSGFDERVHNH